MTANQNPTREEHVNWAKTRANEYIQIGQLTNALDSVASDLTKHSETKEHPAIELSMKLRFIGALSTCEQVQRFIDGIN